MLKQLDMKTALDIKGLAKLFENGGGQGLLDYRHPFPLTFSSGQPGSSRLLAAQCRTCLPQGVKRAGGQHGGSAGVPGGAEADARRAALARLSAQHRTGETHVL